MGRIRRDAAGIRADVSARLSSVRARIGEACRRADRSPEEIRIVAVSKYYPLDYVKLAIELGLTDFGENRPQDLAARASEVPGACRGGMINWHMIGNLQRNKAGLVVDHGDMLHSLSSVKLARALSKRCVDSDRVLECLAQINISDETSKGGFEPDDAAAGIAEIQELPGIRLIGFMGMAAFADDPEEVRGQFRNLREIADDIRRRTAPGTLEELSMGMSNDYEVAVEEGSTIVRIGTAIFGEPPDRE